MPGQAKPYMVGAGLAPALSRRRLSSPCRLAFIRRRPKPIVAIISIVGYTKVSIQKEKGAAFIALSNRSKFGVIQTNYRINSIPPQGRMRIETDRHESFFLYS